MILEFGYGKGIQKAEVPENNVLNVLMSNPVKHARKGPEAVKYALENPIGSKRLKDSVKSGQKIVIVTSDISRPMPSWDAIPAVLDELYSADIPKEDIKIVLALGSHRNHTTEEKIHLVGERAFNEVSVVDSNESIFVHMGETKAGTPVDICKDVAEADFKICMGNIEFHYFAGYSGGYKAIMPGCSTPDAIQCNHRMMINPDACAGKIDGNPIRTDIEEAGRICKVDFIVNAVLDEHKNIVYAVAGDPVKAHRVGCDYLDRMYRCVIKERADIVIVSQGGAPKDANLYQTQKALDNSKYAVKKGGTIIVVGACNEGFGSVKFEKWLTTSPSADYMVEKIGKDFELGGHKAAAIGMVLQNADIYLVSEMEEDLVKKIFLKPAKSVQEALDKCFEKYGKDATVIAMPYGGATLPCPVNKENS